MLSQILELFFPATMAICSGLRAFLPLLVISMMYYTGHVEVAPYFAFFFSKFMLPIYFLLSVAEILVDKFRVFDDFIDNIFLLLRPAASFLAVASQITAYTPMENLLIAFAISLILTGSVHVTKARSRILSSAKYYLSFNLSSSLIEDAMCIVGLVLAFTAPVPAFPIMFIVVFFTMKEMRKVKFSLLDHYREAEKEKRREPRVTKVKKLKKLK
ncbi:MAG: DUF4126 domain-containing protein [Candidatus Eremiobacteraeota bacterium]|nr:DUF4126 domain-containing protein [Candidatus Eremiobacteraeota bacterium]